jgi:uncharacterized DUF497 family protein
MYPISTVFEWDLSKATANLRKHGVSFVEATEAFYDPNGLYRLDQDHSTNTEEREICFGLAKHEILMVVFIELRDGAHVRIISARQADKRETRYYYENQP